MLRMTIATPGCFALIWRAASMPLRFGIVMSSTATSGLTDSAVLHRRRESIGVLPHHDPNLGRPRVFRAIVEGLLHHPIDAGPMRVDQILRDFVGDHLHFEPRPPRDFARLPLQSRDQAEIV